MERKGTVIINGKEVDVAVINGVRYIDGKTVEDYMKTMDESTLLDYMQVGMAVAQDAGKDKQRSPQAMMNELHQKKFN